MKEPGDLSVVPIGCPLGALTDGERAEAGRRLSLVSLAPGQALFRAGDDGEAMYLVASGQVEVRAPVDDPQTVVLATLGPGALVGELGFLTGASRNATVVAGTPAQLWEMGRDPFLAAADAREPWAVQLLLAVSRRLAQRLLLVDRQVATLTAETAAEDDAGTTKVAELEDLRRRLLTDWSF